MLNLLSKRYFFFGLSLLLIIPGLIIIAIYGLPMAIDFVGGSLLEVQFNSGNTPNTGEVIELYTSLGITNTQVQTSEQGKLIIRTPALNDEQRSMVVTKLEEKFSDTVTVLRSETVGPTIGKEVTTRGIFAIAIAAIGVVVYIYFAFRGIPHSLRYGICAILAMIHDVLLVISISGIGGMFFGWQIDSYFLTALLTVIGFSTQDKIVVFDRIRENSNIFRKLPFETLANHSIIQTLQRSINTQLMTSEFLLLALALFGGVTLREFAVVLLIGLASGTYSSIFIAAPLLVVWENKEWKTWFKKPLPSN